MAGQKNMVTRVNQPEILGILWMVLTGLLFLGVTVLVKILGPRVPAPEAAFLRYLLGLVLLIPMLKISLKDKLDSVLWVNFIARGIFHTLAVVLWFFAMTQIPIAEVTAMNYLSPVYVALGAVLFLKEKMAIRSSCCYFCISRCFGHPEAWVSRSQCGACCNDGYCDILCRFISFC